MPLWLRLGFAAPVLTPLLWILALILAILLTLLGSLDLLPESLPHGVILGCGALSAGLTYRVWQRARPHLARRFGGLMPSMQRVMLMMGICGLFGLGAYGLVLNTWLGGVILASIFGYSLLFLRSHNRRWIGPLQAFQDLLNSQQRVQSPGMPQLEVLCFWASLWWLSLSLLVSLDAALRIGYVQTEVRLLGKETRVHKGGSSYYVTLAGWPKAGRIVQMRVHRDDYASLMGGRNYRLRTRKGLLGIERYDSLTLLPVQSKAP